jgi:hypothetical protein
MELREISATNVSPYRCYVRGSSLQSEGPNVHTRGGTNQYFSIIGMLGTVPD